MTNVKNQKISAKAQTVTNEKRIVSLLNETETQKRNNKVKADKNEIAMQWKKTAGLKNRYNWLIDNCIDIVNGLKESNLTDIELLNRCVSDFDFFLNYLKSDEKLTSRFLKVRLLKNREIDVNGKKEIISEVVIRDKESFTPQYIYLIFAKITKIKR